MLEQVLVPRVLREDMHPKAVSASVRGVALITPVPMSELQEETTLQTLVDISLRYDVT